MPLQKITLKPGVNRENTRYTNEGGWYDCDKIRFRQGTPEKIGGWASVTLNNAYLGVARSMWPWATNSSFTYLGVGTNLKYYIMSGQSYYDITPIRVTTAAGDVTFAATNGSATVTITDTAHGAIPNDFVTFSGAVSLGGNITAAVLNKEYQIITVPTVNTYTITATATANASDSGNGGSAAIGAYQINTGYPSQIPSFGWGAGQWGAGTWGTTSGTTSIRVWGAQNFGEDLIYGPQGGPLYYWSVTGGSPLSTRGVALSSLGGAITLPYVSGYPVIAGLANLFTEGTPVTLAANTSSVFPAGINGTTTYYLVNINTETLTCNLSTTPGGTALVVPTVAGSGTYYIAKLVDVPATQNLLLVSDTSRFVFAFGTNDYFSTELDPMLIRWSNQETALDWTPSITNQAGSLRLSHGSAIVAVAQTRQEILVWTDTSLYSLQYVGPPFVWSSTLLTDNVTILSDRAWGTAAGRVFWMGTDKFYVYEGATNTLVCDLLQYIFDDVPGINNSQNQQIFAGTVEKFNEIWWFYCSALTNGDANPAIDRYVVYNYVEKLWYYGTLARTAWIDSSVIDHFPIAADNVTKKLMYQEKGTDDVSTGIAVPSTSFITSAEFDLDDGHNFSFIWRMLPDITFRGSSAASPAVTMYLLPLSNSGSGYNNNDGTNENQSVPTSGQSFAPVTRTGTYPVEQFTGIVYTRIRGRQLSIKVESTALGVQWQLGAPRLDIRPDGRR